MTAKRKLFNTFELLSLLFGFSSNHLLVLATTTTTNTEDYNIYSEPNYDFNQCNYDLVESMPENLVYNRTLSFTPLVTHDVFLDLIRNAKRSILIATFELTLLQGSTNVEGEFHKTMQPGEDIVQALTEAAKRNVHVEILVGLNGFTCDEERNRLVDAGVEIKFLDNKKFLGSGVQHSKLLIADDDDFYLGSSNWDWVAFTHVKEMGILFRQCRKLATDLKKIFRVWSLIVDQDKMPDYIDKKLITRFNAKHPTKVKLDDILSDVYISTSPKQFDGLNNRRTEDIEAILRVIDEAEEFISVSVMNYSPTFSFGQMSYWPVIENSLKKAMYERNVEIRLLFSEKQAKKINYMDMREYQALDAFRWSRPSRRGSIEVKIFRVPAYDEFHKKLTFGRLKHDKYVVTDKAVYFGTSNWSPDYFLYTCGIGITIKPDFNQVAGIEGDQTTTSPDQSTESSVSSKPTRSSTERSKGPNIISKMLEVFDRDYYSEYATYARDDQR